MTAGTGALHALYSDQTLWNSYISLVQQLQPSLLAYSVFHMNVPAEHRKSLRTLTAHSSAEPNLPRLTPSRGQ